MRQRITDETHEKGYYLDAEVLKHLSDDGTTHVSVLASNGDAVAATSSINLR